ncbi:hypothetical protein BH18ACT11_BH18ACT11_23130 [soil metagenome]
MHPNSTDSTKYEPGAPNTGAQNADAPFWFRAKADAAHRVSHLVQIGAVEQGEGRISLRGEFDLHDREALREVLGGVHRRGCSMLLDLSGVTFMDVGCAREVAFWHLLGLEILVPVNTSWQAGLSFAACGLTELARPGASAPGPPDDGGTAR